MNRAALKQLLPHRGTALWLDSVSQIEPTRIVGATTADCLALYGPDCPSYLLYEAAAQLCGVHGASQSKQAKRAYVVKVQRLKIYQTVAEAKPVIVRCELLNNNGLGAQYQFEISQDEVLLSGNLLMVIEHA
ncbi:hotdog family protein [Rheinheimera salexigens]|uniref:3-hydroxylacyl-ACP dehydratase n=1 Tax=Rheinheimera salexigens TaxID=1628148 RepID=A0A1E7Q2N0_9GAMM|nr:hypothetical protein [Rheinheimera salexigens]OEY68435.1 hypothetical protein BI198_01775 [Rheinheimera salexigens]